MEAHFKIPAKFNLKYLEKIDNLNKKYPWNIKITETYWSLPWSITWSARPWNLLENVSIKKLKEYIDKSNELWLDFEYTMNSTSHWWQDLQDGWKELFIDEINGLINAWVKRVTVWTPFLIRLIQKNFPELEVTASINFCVDSMVWIERFTKMWISRIVLKRDINRDFSRLKTFINRSNVELELLLNSLCRLNCNTHQYHNDVNSHSSFISTKKNENVLYPVYECTLEYLNQPENFICSGWIRPEDLKYYMELWYKYFKFDWRYWVSEEKLLKIAESYIKMSYDWDFFDFFSFNLSRWKEKKDSFDYSLENKKLDWFLKPFVEWKMNCTLCWWWNKYCTSFMENIKCNNDLRHEYISMLNKEMSDNF
jgi:collagenase-like PrtC family protease